MDSLLADTNIEVPTANTPEDVEMANGNESKKRKKRHSEADGEKRKKKKRRLGASE
jgi:hypothetical protein